MALNIWFEHVLTFPEDWMPLMTAKKTMIHAASRDRTIFQFSPPLSAIVLVMFSVSRYQKYVVAELFSHSGTTTVQGEKQEGQIQTAITIKFSTFNSVWLFKKT